MSLRRRLSSAARMTRREDRRLLTGRGQYIADFELPHMLHAVLVRSEVAHARIKSIDVSRAAAAPGVCLCADRAGARPRGAAGLGYAGGDAEQMDGAGAAQLHQSAAAAARLRQGAPRRRGGRGDRRGQPLCRRGRRAIGRARSRAAAAGARSGAGVAKPARPSSTTNSPPTSSAPSPSAKAMPTAPWRARRASSSGAFYHHRYAAMPMECRGVVGLLRCRAPMR